MSLGEPELKKAKYVEGKGDCDDDDDDDDVDLYGDVIEDIEEGEINEVAEEMKRKEQKKKVKREKTKERQKMRKKNPLNVKNPNSLTVSNCSFSNDTLNVSNSSSSQISSGISGDDGGGGDGGGGDNGGGDGGDDCGKGDDDCGKGDDDCGKGDDDCSDGGGEESRSSIRGNVTLKCPYISSSASEFTNALGNNGDHGGNEKGRGMGKSNSCTDVGDDVRECDNVTGNVDTEDSFSKEGFDFHVVDDLADEEEEEEEENENFKKEKSDGDIKKRKGEYDDEGEEEEEEDEVEMGQDEIDALLDKGALPAQHTHSSHTSHIHIS